MNAVRLLVVTPLILVLSACSSISAQEPIDVLQQQEPTTTKEPLQACPRAKNPMSVSIYPSRSQLHHPYKVLGLEAVSKYNLGGIKRQEAIIRDSMRKIAAVMGGDAIIDLKYDKKIVQGTVVSYDTNPKPRHSV